MTALSQDIPMNPTEIITGVFLGETPPLRDLPVLTDAEKQKMHEKAQKKLLNPKIRYRSYPYAESALPKGPDPAWQRVMGNNRETKALVQSYDGAETATYNPTDANGTIGPNHYMQTINTVYTIYDRTGLVVAGPTALNSLFYWLPGADFNDGDPIVLYDEQADRWLLAEFSYSGNNDYMLIAVSTTNDPTGTWYKYSFDVADKPDYEKFGIWRDGYYMGTNNPNGNDIYVFNRSQMLLGQTAQMVGFDNPNRPTTWDGFMCVPPLDNDGPFAPEGEPGLFITLNDDAVAGGSDELWIYELDVDWTTPANSTFIRAQQISVASFDSNFGPNYNNIAQPPTSPELDAIPMVIMNPPQYRNFGDYETIVCCHTVDADGTDHAGIRWYELRRVNSGNWSVRQQSTYAPDAHSRWMGSIMLNGSSEIALGYSISSSTVYPGIRYSGQSATAYAAANNTLDVAEEIILTGTYSQTSARWGDYSSLQVDVADDETFWYTNQYIGASNLRKTKIASFQIGTVILTANFAASKTNPQLHTLITLTDVSYGSPTSWNWSISPSTFNYVAGTSSTSQHPQVQFTEAGTYSATLIISNGSSYDTIIKTNFINVSDCGYTSLLPFTEDFSEEVLPPCWQNIDNVGYGIKWIFHHPGQFNIHTTTDENGFAILDSYHHGDTMQNADLITPTLDLSSYTTVNLKFIYFYPAYSPDPYKAYGKLYYSINDGLSWNLLQTWSSSADSSVYSQNIAQVAGQSKVKFKWNYTGYGYFWAIDDINITGTGPNTWTGNTSTAWATATNWSSGTVPISTTKVIIPSTATNWPTLSGDFTLGTTCDKIMFYGPSQLSINGNVIITTGKTMAINGNASVNLSGNWISSGGIIYPGKSTITFTGATPSCIIPATTSTSGITNYLRSIFPVGMTPLTSPTTGPTGNNTGLNVSIGFTFTYLGISYTQARICTNGWVQLGTSTSTSSTNDALFATSAPNLCLAPWYDDLNDDATSVVSYKTEGTSPYRVLTVEWKNVLTYSLNATERINFQAKLYETTNIIEFHYGTVTSGTNSISESASIGIENATGGSGNFIEATTGSTTNGVTNLTSTSNWPTVNYRFTPVPGTLSFYNITSNKSSTYLDLLANNLVNGSMTISSGTVSGPTASTSTLQVKGNFTNNGTYTPGSGTVILNGTSNQDIGGTSATTFYNLTLNNTSGISLLNNQNISGNLTMTEGNVNSGSYTLTLGTSASSTGTFNYSSGNITGSFKRWIAASTGTPIDFPVGTLTGNHNARITFTDNTGGSLTARFEPGDPGNNSGFPLSENELTLNESDQYTEGSWTLVPTTLSSSSYSLELRGTGFISAGVPDETVRIMKRPDGGGNWTLNGTHVAGSAPVAKRSGLAGFSRFALAKPNLLRKISGTITYYNSSNTLLNTGVIVKLYQYGIQVGSDYAVTDGTYEFSGLTPGAYELRAFSSNSAEGSINTTDAAQVNYWGAIPYQVEKVRFYAGDVTGATYYVNSTDALRIQNHFVNGTAFDKGTWAFWRAGETIGSNSNPPESYPQVTVSTSNINANLYGLCAGDFNRSFIPGTLKSTWPSPELIHSGARLAGCNESVELPLLIAEACTLGAISLILNLPGDLVEINDVMMNETGGSLDWSCMDNQLKISWFTANPIYVAAKNALFILKLKTTEKFTSGNIIKISLADNPLNELADGRFDALINPVLETDLIEAVSAGTGDMANQPGLSLECRPNPFNNQAVLFYFIPYEGLVTIEIKSVTGYIVSLITDQFHPPGRYSINTRRSALAPGVYLATLRLQSKNKSWIKNIKLIKE